MSAQTLQQAARDIVWFIREARELADTPADQRDAAYQARLDAFLARKAEVLSAAGKLRAGKVKQ